MTTLTTDQNQDKDKIEFLEKALNQALILCNHEDLQKLIEENKIIPEDQQYFPELTKYLNEKSEHFQSQSVVIGLDQKRELLMALASATDVHLNFICNIMGYGFNDYDAVNARSELFFHASKDDRLNELWNLVF